MGFLPTSNHRQLHCLFNKLLRLMTEQTLKVNNIGLCEGNPPVAGGFPNKWPIMWKSFTCHDNIIISLIAKFMGPTWGPSGAGRTQVGPMLAPWILQSGMRSKLLALNLCFIGIKWVNSTLPEIRIHLRISFKQKNLNFNNFHNIFLNGVPFIIYQHN